MRTHPESRNVPPPPRRRGTAFPLWIVRTTRGPTSRPMRPGSIGVDLRARDRRDERTLRARPRRPGLSRRLQAWWQAESDLSSAPAAARIAGATIPAGAPASDTATVPRTRRRRRMDRALVGLGLMQLVIIAVIVWGLTAPTWRVSHVRVQGTTDGVVVTAIQKLPLGGCNVFLCDTTRQARLVESLPWVAHAEVHTVYPNGLLVVIQPRLPVLRWQIGDQALLLASDGTVLGTPASDPAYTGLALPAVQDDGAQAFGGQVPRAGSQISPQLVNMAGQLRTALVSVLGDGWTLEYTSSAGLSAVNASGDQVLFGTPDQAAQAVTSDAVTAQTVQRGVAMQLAELQALRALLAHEGQHATVIDLRWGAHPYYRLAGGA
jgi:hypothetical protein